MTILDRITTFTAAGRAFILDRKPIPHSTQLWRVKATDGQVWFGVWHKGFTEPMFLDAPKRFILRDTPWAAIDSGNNYPVTYYAADYGFPEEKESEGTVYITHWQPLGRPEAPGVDDGA